MNDTQIRVMNIVNSHSKINGELSPEDRLSDIGIDSLEKVEVIVELEDEFLICFDDSMLVGNSIRKVSDLLEMVESCVGK